MHTPSHAQGEVQQLPEVATKEKKLAFCLLAGAASLTHSKSFSILICSDRVTFFFKVAFALAVACCATLSVDKVIACLIITHNAGAPGAAAHMILSQPVF